MIVVDYKRCDDCCTCISVCPENSIVYKDRLEVDGDSCVLCGKCVKVCPFAALSIKKVK